MIHIITDSSANVTSHVTVVPTYVYIGVDTLRDGVDITSEQMRQTLERTYHDEVTTSEPPSADFIKAYERILERDPTATIFSIHVSGAISGTYASATRAARSFPESDIRVFDSRTCTVGHAMLVLMARECAANGDHPDTIEANLLAIRDTQQIVIALGGISALKDAGRLWRLALLSRTDHDKLTPTITLTDGIIEGLTPHLNLNDAYTELIERAAADQPTRIGIAYGTDEATATTFADRIATELRAEVVSFEPFCATFLYYFQPGSIGVAWST